MSEAANACSQIRTPCANNISTGNQLGILVAVLSNFVHHFSGDFCPMILESDVTKNFTKVVYCLTTPFGLWHLLDDPFFFQLRFPLIAQLVKTFLSERHCPLTLGGFF